jgi:hypothetical protein
VSCKRGEAKGLEGVPSTDRHALLQGPSQPILENGEVGVAIEERKANRPTRRVCTSLVLVFRTEYGVLARGLEGEETGKRPTKEV